MSVFSTINAIDWSTPSTWAESVFLTLDIDWAHDDVLAETIDLMEAADVAATWFVTHSTPLLERLRNNPKFELGIHPNFNPLLQGNPPKLGWTLENVLEEIMHIVPEAVSVRSHSMTQSTRMLDTFQKYGLRFDCNHFIPWHAEIPLKPWLHWNQGLVRVPYCWEDDIFVLEQKEIAAETLLQTPGLRVLDFHPIHIALNTAHLETYEASRAVHHQLQRLKEFRAPGNGVETYLRQVIQVGKRLSVPVC